MRHSIGDLTREGLATFPLLPAALWIKYFPGMKESSRVSNNVPNVKSLCSRSSRDTNTLSWLLMHSCFPMPAQGGWLPCLVLKSARLNNDTLSQSHKVNRVSLLEHQCPPHNSYKGNVVPTMREISPGIFVQR